MFGNEVTLRTEGEVRSLVALLEHPRLVRAVRIVAVQTSAFLGGIVDRRRVLERIWSLKLVVTLEADIAGRSKLELPVGLIQRHMTLCAFHDPVEHRVPERPGEFTFDLLMAIDTEPGFGLLEETYLFVRVDLVASAAVDVILRVDVPFLHVLLVGVGVAA